MQDFYKTEKCFRRYEPAIIAACTAHPQAIRFAPPDTRRSFATDKARVRDTITAWCDAKWPTSPHVTSAKMRELTVWHEQHDNIDYIFVGPHAVRKQRLATRKLTAKLDIPFDIETLPTEEVPTASALALSRPSPTSLSDRIAALDAGTCSERFVYPFTPELHAEITTLISDKLNVQLVVRDGNIILF